jgi:hypothetical protein
MVWTIPRGGLRQRVSEEENSNSPVVIFALSYYCKVHPFVFSGINRCDSFNTCVKVDSWILQLCLIQSRSYSSGQRLWMVTLL